MLDVSGDTPLDAYRSLCRQGALESDPAQERAVEKLQMLHGSLRHYDPRGDGGWRQWLGLKAQAEPPPGLYLHGAVGRGKSMLMDLFYRSAPVKRKRRTHFHPFMLDVHERIDRFRKLPRDRRDGDDPLPPVARQLADEAWLLCFDEFEVRDVADAMILGRLFTRLLEQGVVVVATSNRAPDMLYEGGLNRQLFLPFIALLKQRLHVLHLDGGVDYRMRQLRGMPVYLTPIGERTGRELDRMFERLTDRLRGEPEMVEVKGRALAVPEQARGVARFGFAELCERPLGAVDYLALAARYHTLILSDIPRLGREKRNEARRFATLIDVLYDNGMRLICSAAVPPDQLYPEGDGAFEFARTASRLVEMQSESYVARPRG